ncbi:hypothetical protein [Aequorivita lipolytica]|uniref:Uncharacterized protein n=1 Tax=Aequorivita lipolytica TaxID=153267 RepID=A0A5C6YPR8_9FLAO|nr:hypothetical protein [Aequorivita lipolytica]TXD68852.1 hypothetical protein ESV24_10390 [Aequorivita lipolytica]SRX52111.1 hypothetical protein AEQU2_02090 [Aequorivita lipolytica]
MIKSILAVVAIFILGNFSNSLFAQQKFEKESRLAQSDVPMNALNFIDSLKLKNKVKWYLEEGLERKSIEAKFKRNRKKHSVEFDALGNIEDVEIEIKWDELTTPLKNSIGTRLQKDCIKHRINKIQIQYTGNQIPLFLKLLSGKPTEDLTVKYEIIVKCRSEKSTELFEYLFTDKGHFVLASQIIFKPSYHLEY